MDNEKDASTSQTPAGSVQEPPNPGTSRVEKVDRSIVEFFGESTNHCGYCKSEDPDSEGRKSHDMRAYHLRPADYQLMLDRSWRRSGTYCYRPVNSSTCCPNYPLSCDALRFRLSRSQRRCIENLNSFLIRGSIHDRLKLNYKSADQVEGSTKVSSESRSFELLKRSPKARDKRFVASCERKVKLDNLTLDEAISETIRKNLGRQHQAASLEQYLFPRTTALPATSTPLQATHRLRIKMHYVDSKDSRALRVEENELIKRYQKKVHKEEPSEWTMSRFSDFLIRSPLIVEPIQELDEDGQSNKDTLTRDCSTSDYLLVRPPELPTAYGTYHCVYYLDDKMIAVGVLDVLPKCITTVYFFYEPEYGFLNLGTYSALIEISMVQQMYRYYSSIMESCKLIYYYLGFYVPLCKKMHYKTTYQPSHLLCSETHRYVPTEICLKLLEGKKYCKFYQNEAETDDETYEVDIFDIPVTTPVTSTNRMVDYLNWIKINFGDEYVRLIVTVRGISLLNYIQVIGPKLIPRLTLRIRFLHEALAEKHRWSTSQSRMRPSTRT